MKINDVSFPMQVGKTTELSRRERYPNALEESVAMLKECITYFFGLFLKTFSSKLAINIGSEASVLIDFSSILTTSHLFSERS